uniref:Bumetanide-sensitive sodium-(Potassium)-chloride cotransporter n=1 Tax=Strigamia maritima TaxID=126957 RepID=T1JEV4_STRMM
MMNDDENRLNNLRQEGEWLDMSEEKKEAQVDKGQSRFHVAKVDFVGDQTNDERDNENNDDNQMTTHSGSTNYDTHYLKSLRHLTREALPRIDHYRNLMSVHAANRPTLEELHSESIVDGKTQQQDKDVEIENEGKGVVKFGWIQGVLIRCLLNIWGVMLFLRLSWVVGQAGILEASIIVLLASVVTVLTSLSAAAICTNGMVKGGGTYYMISRSLGPEFGGSIGLIFSFANAVAIAMYVVGFCESFTDMLQSLDLSLVGDQEHDIRIIGSIVLVVLLAITVVGMEWESRAQIVLLIILILAMADFIIGSFIPPSDEEKAKGFLGYDVDIVKTNFLSDYRDGEDFFTVFSVFFPAATGILAGANISGDLADPSKAIPQGTLLAIVITTVSYLIFACLVGSCVVRDADGVIENLENGVFKDCGFNNTCKYGLIKDYQVMELVSIFGPIIYAGCFAATLSSALASLVSAPKVFQALCKDKLYPYIHVFAKGYGKNNEPYRAYALCFIIALGFILIAKLNAIAPIISNFFLASYCLVNYSCFHASLAKSPGFRPGFRYYNMWVSLVGGIVCLAVMFIINWWTALLTFGICFALYMYISHAKPDVNWGSSTQAQTYRSALQSVIKLNQVEEHVKNYRPQILVLSGFPSSRPPLVDFANNITKNLSLLVCGHVVEEQINQRVRNSYFKHAYAWLQRKKIKGFYYLIDGTNLAAGSRSLMQTAGVGKLKPNMVLLGFKSDWQTCKIEELQSYFSIIHDAFDNYLAVGILRLQQGLDYGHFLEAETAIAIMTPALLAPPLPKLSVSIDSNINIRQNFSSSQLSTGGSSSSEGSPATGDHRGNKRADDTQDGSSDNETTKLHPNKEAGKPQRNVPREVLAAHSQFQRKQKKGTIDVWWLYDDGGLSMLIPYILTTRKQWRSCKLRVFALANRKDELDEEQRNLAALLSKFRINYSDVIVIPDVQKRPQESSKAEFESIIKKFRENEDADTNSRDGRTAITDAELLALKDRTLRHIRLRELLQKYSKDSTLIVMTLPMPRKGTVSAPLYLAWLDTLTRDLPPFLLLRGNQTNVITFYS